MKYQLALFAMLTALFSANAATAKPVLSSTKCSTIKSLVNSDDEQSLQAVYDQIIATLSRTDRVFVARLSQDGRLAIAGVAEDLCTQHSNETLADVTMRAYRSLSGVKGLTAAQISLSAKSGASTVR